MLTQQDPEGHEHWHQVLLDFRNIDLSKDHKFSN